MKRICCFAFCFCFFLAAPAQVKKVDAIGIVVSDLDRALKFYTDVLRFEKVSESEAKGEQWEKLYGLFGLHLRSARLRLGDECVEIIDYLTPGGRSIPEDFQSNDLAFQHIAIVVSNMDSAYAVLRRHGVTHVSTAPQTLPASIPAAAGISAFYFQDPDRHVLELICFPKGKGQDKWQQANGKLFLGIDHTAIGVSRTVNSHRFYHDLLGFDRKGDSWNKGTEQAHLNNVKGASLHITGYRSGAGPGVEFLEYLSPGPGRKYPAHTRPDDLWNWLTVVQAANVETLYRRLKAAGYQTTGERPVKEGVAQKAILVRDPDGHAVLLREE